MKWRPIVFGIIIVICIASINYSIYWMFQEDAKKAREENLSNTTAGGNTRTNAEEILSQFNAIFDNTIDNQGYEIETSVAKKDLEKELVYARNTRERKSRPRV